MKVKKSIRNGILILTILLFGIYLGNRYSEPIPFDSEKWKTQSETEMSIRWDMMNSLRENHTLKGMTKIEIIELLGKPTQIHKSSISYDLGPSKRGVNYGFLELTFNEREIVTDFVVGDH
ncbi:hypothetical protein [Cytophaga sp. FL35]|uniref:hypothetical protein n=1 Tax=Cytophaga sp. FL35 TaxID=1904456 RepID=UPI0016535D38|nr:hypothetical protein [Cytophaga sp. FL35]MBC6999673.1 hypothetical protein [Cytophaga sp. FL35]